MIDNINKFDDMIAEIFAVGTWNRDHYSETDLAEMVHNFEILKGKVQPPAKIGHSEDQLLLKKEGLPAAGWVDKLKLVGNKVVASFRDVPKVIRELIEKKAYKRVSAEIYPRYKDPETGKIYKNVLRAVAFLGADIPAVETLSDIKVLYSSDIVPDGSEVRQYSIDIDKLTKKGGELLMGKWKVSIEGSEKEEIVKKLTEAFGEGVKVNVEDANASADAGDKILTPEEQAKLDEERKAQEIKSKKIEELTQQYEAVTKLQGDKDKEIADLKAKILDLEAKLKEKEGVVGSKGDEVGMMAKKLSEKDEEIKKLSKELENIEKEQKDENIKSFVKKQVEGGKILPKDESSIVALMGQLDDKTIVKFTQDNKETSESIMEVLKKFISGLPKVVEFKEVSPHIEHKVQEDGRINIGGVSYEVMDVELVQRAEKYAQENKVAFDVALIKVSEEQ